MRDAETQVAPVIVKVGGSLLELPDLGPRLQGWLGKLPTQQVLLVPGGGPTTDVIRDFDRHHGLGEERAHWLALQALTLNAYVLAALLPRAAVVPSVNDGTASWLGGGRPIVDAHAFARADDGQPGCLPHCWAVTSDSLAARIAQVANAQRLVLLKSIDAPADLDWWKAAGRGLVDAYFPEVIAQARGRTPAFDVELVNFRRLRD